LARAKQRQQSFNRSGGLHGIKAGTEIFFKATKRDGRSVVVALKMPGTKLEWDAQAMKFTNRPEANAFVDPPYRQGRTL
jgi:hypothetical protein